MAMSMQSSGLPLLCRYLCGAGFGVIFLMRMSDGSTGWVNDAFFTPLWLNSSTVTVAAFFGIGSR